MSDRFQLYPFLLLFSICIPIFLIYQVHSLDYQGLVSLLKPHYFDTSLRKQEYQIKYFHPGRMPLLSTILWSLLFIWMIGIYILFRPETRKRLYEWKLHLRQIITQYKTIWYSTPIFYKWILAVSGICLYSFKLYFFLTIPENKDATVSFKEFVEQGFWGIVTYYPDTNNHIFFNLLCLPFSWIFPGQSLWDMTLPNILIGTVTLLWLFCELTRRWNYTTALLSIVWIASFYESSRYFFQGRGHLPIVLFSLISTFILLSGKLRDRRKVYFPIFIISCILGLYTVPTFVLHVFALCIFGLGYALIHKDQALFENLILGGIWITLGTLFCYLPVIAISGFDSIIHTGPAHPQSQAHALFLVFIAEWTEYILGIFLLFRHAFLVAIPVGIIILITLFQKKLDSSIRIWIYFTIVSVGVFFVFSWITWLLPEYRVFSFFIWHLYIAFVLVLMHWIPKITRFPILIFVTTILIVTGSLLYTRAEHLRALDPMHADLSF
ncbi:hypothetical protein QNI19_29345 [Cytophagaceae bacterium DM2B3-1]|uniref:Glycosyltransferase RgtA/B/C/D-like domain-containing protein n=1 Tax=Xanthocytophaga flava TaxID=3048013 RepID=A0ABT7CWT7_9BACT|nr:hypothetical protein [Xanthocytophaga flavus]MDJ1497079.1 hypothetical protein [Xanthocytophaga flavus]